MKLDYKRTFFVGLAFMSICAFWQLYDSIIPKILTYSFNMEPTARGVIMALDNVLAIFMLPLFGAISDRISTPFGKRIPFIFCGTAVSVAAMMMLPFADRSGNFTWFIIALAIVLIAMGTYRSPAVALMPDLTPKPLRSKANAVINLMGALGGVYTLAMISLTVGEDANYLPVFSAVAVMMILAVLILVFTVREKKLARELAPILEEAEKDSEADNGAEASENDEKNNGRLSGGVLVSMILLLVSVFLWFTAYNGVTSTYTVYTQEVWGLTDGSFANSMMIGTVAAVISYIPIGFISTAFGRKKVILAGIVLMTLCYTGMLFITSYNFFVYICLVLIGFGWAAINVNSYPMVVEMSRGSSIGRYTGIYYVFSMAAQIITPIFSGFLIEKIGYKVLFPYAAIFSVCAFITMLFVRHGDSKPKKKASVIENLDAMD